MDKHDFDGLCAYMASLWGRELSNLQRAGGWKMLHNLPNEAVEGAVVAISEGGRETMPPWPLVFKTAQTLADAIRDRMPALPQGDTLSPEQHAAAMIALRAKQTPEQRRRADRVTSETKFLDMSVRLAIAKELLVTYARVDAASWNRVFDERVKAERDKKYGVPA